jgi:hypothetical protein
MAKRIEQKKEAPAVFEITIDRDDCLSIWKYDKSKSTNGPISVEHRWKPAAMKRIQEYEKTQKQLKKAKKKSVK